MKRTEIYFAVQYVSIIFISIEEYFLYLDRGYIWNTGTYKSASVWALIRFIHMRCPSFTDY